jgi:SNF2 family DNA or RNA helicase
MLKTWADEFQRHGNISNVVVIDGSSKKAKFKKMDEAIATTPAATVATYGIATLYHDHLLKVGYKGIIADESHQMKSPFAKRTKAAAALASRAYRRVLLSGTPSLGSPFDMYGQLRFLGPYFCPEDWWTFRKMFGIFHPSEAHEKVPKMVIGYKNLDHMNARVNRVCLRKTKEECLDLPDQVILDSYFALEHSQVKEYNNLILSRGDDTGVELQQEILDGTLSHAAGPVLPPYLYAPEPITLLGKLDQISSGFYYQSSKNPRLCDGCPRMAICSAEEIQPYTSNCAVVQKEKTLPPHKLKDNARLEHCKELIESVLEDPDNKVIIWAVYHAELDDICNALHGLGLKHVRVQGGMSSADIAARMNSFENDKDCRAYVGQVSTGIGVTLNAANYTIYYSLPWSLEHYQQSLDRNYRIGQSRKVTVYRLLGRYTLDESKATALDQKVDFSKLVTSRSFCISCPEYTKRCAVGGVELFSDGCILDKAKLRETASARLIPT